MSIGNTTYTENTKQAFPLSPPPLKPRKRKDSQDCFRSYIDQLGDGLYSSSKLVRNEPRTNRDIYFKFRPRKARPTEMKSFRRHYSHVSRALFRTKRGGSTKSNIAYLTGSFLELDGSTDNTIKTQGDVQALINKNSLPMPSYVIQTSLGHYHVIWNYVRPLPWTTKGESFWISQQKKKIELFRRAGFNVDVGASLNPCQFLRNPSQLNAFNFKRRCKVVIHKSYSKTSLRAIYRALNKTSIPNPKKVKASVLLRRFSRANKDFTATHAELAITLGMSLRTIKTQVSRAIQNGDLRIVARTGNNSGQVRTTQYESMLFIEQFPEVQLSSIKINSFKETNLLADFQANGAENRRRNKTIFALGLYLKAQLGKRACIEAIRAQLVQGARACHVREKEFERTLKNVMKNSYSNPFSISKLREWDLIEETKHFH